MDSREAVLKALKEGKQLTSVITGIRYKLIDGHIYARNSESEIWMESGLTFLNPASWLNLRD
ncbi:hypothetical protein LOH54_09160 [Sulfurimonas sp. HSL-3221]|uniref:hypothetical protein n=1 Tax=Sulfurimonadaceae TaxID=2771471 RepID=UPI001E2DB667|nr:hypothetical protein [Sulfurimonas sp. HSL-3221]UFS61824.1 hypothetical protein LOH54_09160 [Sulfurimonas sp. HSL-3221]